MRRTERRYGSSPSRSDDGAAAAGPTPGRRSRSAARYGVQAKKAGPVQRRADGGEAGELAPLPGSGQPLAPAVQTKMESSFGADFSGVRVHTDSPQAESIGALAYTQGSEIAFAPGTYQPDSQSGQELIGHELAHVVQQTSGRVAAPAAGASPINESSSLEREADEMGARAARGEAAPVTGRGAGSQPKRGGPVQALFGRRTKAAAKGAGVGLGKGLINAVFPVFSWLQFFENIDDLTDRDNPLLGQGNAKDGALIYLICTKEVGQLVAALATTVATIFGIAAIAQPALAAIATVAGIVATTAHALTFVLRGLTIWAQSAQIKRLKKAGEVAKAKRLEKQRWAEIGGMIGNGIGVIFGGVGLSPAWAATVKPMGDSGGNAMSAGFGQIGNSLADTTGGATEEGGGAHVDRPAPQQAPPQQAPPQQAPPQQAPPQQAPPQQGPTVEDRVAIGQVISELEQVIAARRARQAELVTAELAGNVRQELDEIQQNAGDLEADADRIDGADTATIEEGNPEAVGEQDAAAAEEAVGGVEGGGEEREGGGEGGEGEGGGESSAPVQRKAKTVQRKPGWFKRRILGRIKKAADKAKKKFITKVAKMFGLDKKAAEAKTEVATEAGKVGEARQAENEAKEAAGNATELVEELKRRNSSGGD